MLGVDVMTYKLRLSVFRFDAKSDYLPFYKKHIIKIDGEKTLNDLLLVIKEEDLLFDFPTDKNAAIRVSGQNLFTDVKIDTIVENFGDELTLMPMSEKRALKDLIVNKDDFYDKFDLLDAYVNASDRKRFEELVLYHYASDVNRYSDEFQGDALFLFAYEMIEKYPAYRGKILDILDNEHGIWLHTNLCGKVFPVDYSVEEKIDKLKNEVLKARN
jgi:succinate dehydrogenase/fumarate reductase-like Fe-S protein